MTIDSDNRTRVRRAIEAALVEEHGPAALTRGPISSTISIEVTRPADYLTGIRAAQRVKHAADAESREYAQKARGEGRTWQDIADALDLDTVEYDDPAIAAFRWVAPEPSQRFDPICTSWECVSCGARVIDSGPYSGHPDDTEDGHAQHCPRHAAEVKAYLQAAGWDE